MVETKYKEYSILVEKNQQLNLTCIASVGCNDINYDIHFTTDSKDAHKVIMNTPDRSKCLINFNEYTNFTKSIIFSSMNTNATKVNCDIRFGPELKTESPSYFLYFASESFIRYDAKDGILVNYDEITESHSSLRIESKFESSASFNIDWFLEDKLISFDDKDNQQKYVSECIPLGIFSHHCFLNIYPYIKEDVGLYTAKISLKSNPDIKIRLDVNAIMPSNY